MINYLAIFQILAFTAYIVYLWRKVGVLPSISDSWYRLNEVKDNAKYDYYVDAISGKDTNPGTQEKPFKTMWRAIKVAKSQKKMGHLFNWWVAAVGLPMWGYGAYEVYGDWAQVVFALSGFCLFCVGIASSFREKMVDKIHYTGAVLAIGLGFLGIWIQYHTVFQLGLFIGLALLLKGIKIKNYTWWIEIVAFVLIIGKLVIL
jgi:hypothetical protein